ncbi:transposase zinc-binding domain-containing protein [Providencia rettgeri]|nr:transposase zinc-binding domain-containing protein [Providencia stuartii]
MWLSRSRTIAACGGAKTLQVNGCPQSLSPVIIRCIYIPRPAKLLFQIDDGWNRLLIKHGPTVPEWTKLVIERMLACGTGAMGIRRYCCASPDCTHSKYFCQSCKCH